MNKNRKTQIIPWVLGVLLAAGAAVHAEGGDKKGMGPGGGGEMRGGHFGKFKKELGLSEEQAKKLKEHRQQHQEQGKVLRENARTAKEALRAELEKPNFSESTAKSPQARMKDAHDKLADHRLQGILDVRKILTPEQFAKFQELTKERRGDRKERREEWREEKGERREEWREKKGEDREEWREKKGERREEWREHRKERMERHGEGPGGHHRSDGEDVDSDEKSSPPMKKSQ